MFFTQTLNQSGGNDQQRKRALSECIRQPWERTAATPDLRMRPQMVNWVEQLYIIMKTVLSLGCLMHEFAR